MNELDSKTINGYTVTVYRDEYADSPRKDRDNLLTLTTFHPRYNLGDVNTPDFDEFRESLKGCLVYSFTIVEHGMVSVVPNGSLVIDINDMEKHSHTGYAHVSIDNLCDEYPNLMNTVVSIRNKGVEHVPDAVKKAVLNNLKAELSALGMWMEGSVYEVVVTDPETGENVESMCGVYADTYDEVYETVNECGLVPADPPIPHASVPVPLLNEIKRYAELIGDGYNAKLHADLILRRLKDALT